MTNNLLQNGDFARGLYQWTGDGTVSRADGYPRLNCARLANGQSLSQQYGISEENLYTLHYFYKLATGATLTVAYGSVSQEHSGAPLDVWREGVLVFSVESGGGNEGVVISAAGGVVLLDTITLMSGGLPKSRAQLASETAANIVDLVTDAGLSATASATGPEGDYTTAIDEALRAIGAMTTWGDPDVTMLQAAQVNNVLEAVKIAVLQRIRSGYALQTDVTLGPRSESLSQKASSIDEMLAGAGSDRRPKMAKLHHAEWRR